MTVWKWSEFESLDNRQGALNVVKANFAIEKLTFALHAP